MANRRQTKKNAKKSTAKKTPRNSKKLFPCDKCSKKFAKKSNLDNHKRVKHKGLVWICPFCQKTQVSKYSHERHLKTCPHRNQREQAEQINADANSVYLSSKIEYTPKAASTLIDQLTKNNVYRANVIIDLKKKYLLSLKRIIALKRILKLSHQDEDEEIEQLQTIDKEVEETEEVEMEVSQEKSESEESEDEEKNAMESNESGSEECEGEGEESDTEGEKVIDSNDDGAGPSK